MYILNNAIILNMWRRCYIFWHVCSEGHVPYLENRSGKVGLTVGRRLSLFDLTEPSSPERVGDSGFAIYSTFRQPRAVLDNAMIPFISNESEGAVIPRWETDHKHLHTLAG